MPDVNSTGARQPRLQTKLIPERGMVRVITECGPFFIMKMQWDSRGRCFSGSCLYSLIEDLSLWTSTCLLLPTSSHSTSAKGHHWKGYKLGVSWSTLRHYTMSLLAIFSSSITGYSISSLYEKLKNYNALAIQSITALVGRTYITRLWMPY